MKTIIIFAIAITCWGKGFSQTYVYTFSGELDPFSITKLEKECTEIKDIISAKIKYKSESKKGEMYITLSPRKKNTRAESEEYFSPIVLKTFLLSNKLSPLSFREKKD